VESVEIDKQFYRVRIAELIMIKIAPFPIRVVAIIAITLIEIWPDLIVLNPSAALAYSRIPRITPGLTIPFIMAITAAGLFLCFLSRHSIA